MSDTTDGENLPPPIREEQWDAFREAGLLWWVNRQLQLFGWSICVEVGKDDPTKTLRAFPIKSDFRGFSEVSEEEGFKALAAHLHENSADLAKVAGYTPPRSKHD